MPTTTTSGNGAIVVSALSLRTNLGKILRRLDVERRSLVIEKRGTPTEVLKLIGQEANRNRTAALTSRQIDEVIRTARSEKKKR
jgi:hypothetical protein